MKNRPGFSLTELMLALIVFAIAVGAVLTFFQVQLRSFGAGMERSAVTQAAQFGMSVLRREVATAGSNVPAQQPWLVYADTNVIAFHGDYASNVPDPFAVYIDPHATVGETRTLRKSDRYTLPLTSFTYPDTTYWSAPGLLSPAELIVFWFEPDTFTARTDDYVLYRRVNALPPEIVTRNVLRADSTPFLQYLRLGVDSAGQPALNQVPPGDLPFAHTVPIHNSPADTGTAARIDGVRAVRITYAVSNGRRGAEERRVNRTQLVWLRNGGLARQRTCGSPPIFTGPVTAAVDSIAGKLIVRVQWSASVDETGGEGDVIRYVLWRHSPLSTPDDPLVSIPSGGAPYVFNDPWVQSGEEWVYSVAAQDCTPTLSAPVSTSSVIIP